MDTTELKFEREIGDSGSAIYPGSIYECEFDERDIVERVELLEDAIKRATEGGLSICASDCNIAITTPHDHPKYRGCVLATIPVYFGYFNGCGRGYKHRWMCVMEQNDYIQEDESGIE